MKQTEIETAFAELVKNITGTQPARIDRDPIKSVIKNKGK
jgi:hypothetical protein